MVPAASRRLAEKKTFHQVPDQEQAGEQGKRIGEEMIQGGSSYAYSCKNFLGPLEIMKFNILAFIFVSTELRKKSGSFWLGF